MITARNDQPRIRHLFFEYGERRQHQLQPFVGPPLSEREDAMHRIAASAEIGKLGPPGQDAMRTQVHVIAAIFLEKDLAVAGHQN